MEPVTKTLSVELEDLANLLVVLESGIVALNRAQYETPTAFKPATRDRLSELHNSYLKFRSAAEQ